MNTEQYRKLARKHNRPVVLVAHKATPAMLSMMGGQLPIDYEAAVLQAEQAVGSGNFVRSLTIKPTGELMVRIPGLNGVYCEASIDLLT